MVTASRNTYTVIKCELFVHFDDYLGSDSIKVISRVYKYKPSEKNWTLSTSSDSAFYPYGDKKVLVRLFNANRFVVRATPYNESPKTLIFDVRGIHNALGPHAEVCGW